MGLTNSTRDFFNYTLDDFIKRILDQFHNPDKAKHEISRLYQYGLESMIQALIEADVDNKQIKEIVHKYYDIDDEELEYRIRENRTVFVPRRKFEDYLVNYENFSRQEARDYTVKKQFVKKLKDNRQLYKKSDKELFDMFENEGV